jgi:hypothetical protein
MNNMGQVYSMNMSNDKWDGAKFMHFMRDDNEHYGGATVCYAPIDGDTYMTIAYCHPKDRFVKAYGRAKSFGLLNQLIVDPVKWDSAVNIYGKVTHMIIYGEPDVERVASAAYEAMGPAYVPR